MKKFNIPSEERTLSTPEDFQNFWKEFIDKETALGNEPFEVKLQQLPDLHLNGEPFDVEMKLGFGDHVEVINDLFDMRLGKKIFFTIAEAFRIIREAWRNGVANNLVIYILDDADALGNEYPHGVRTSIFECLIVNASYQPRYPDYPSMPHISYGPIRNDFYYEVHDEEVSVQYWYVIRA